MMGPETALLVAGSGCYAVGAGCAWQERKSAVAYWVLLGSAVFAAAITVRWITTGQGPFLTMFEILVSSLFSLGLIYGIACLMHPQARNGATIATGILLIMAAWLVFTDARSTPLPATYGNPWLWVHVALGKLFLGCCLVASSLAASGLVGPLSRHSIVGGPDQVAWRWFMIAFVFHTGMLIAGAVWAQDAWGRYWAWDPLETWAFATWLLMAFAMHARLTLALSARTQRLLIVAAFLLAFLTFFGVPFISMAPHKGAV